MLSSVIKFSQVNGSWISNTKNSWSTKNWSLTTIRIFHELLFSSIPVFITVFILARITATCPGLNHIRLQLQSHFPYPCWFHFPRSYHLQQSLNITHVKKNYTIYKNHQILPMLKSGHNKYITRFSPNYFLNYRWAIKF